MSKYQLEITSNGGYGPNQVHGITVRDLLSLLEDFNEDDEIILHDEGNRYGAAYGFLHGDYQEARDEDEEEEEDY